MPGINPPTPYNWNVGDTGNAAVLNAQLRDGLTFLLNPPYFFGYQASATAQSITSSGGTFVSVILDSEFADTEGGHSTTTNNTRYTCQIPGRYHVEGCVVFSNANTTGFRAAKFLMNGSTSVPGSESAVATASFNTTVRNETDIYMNAGDYIELQCLQNSGVALTLAANSTLDYVTHLRLWWLANQ